MRYFGSKVSTIETIHNLVSKRMPSGSFCDPFGGIGSVGSYFQSKGYSVWSGDILNFAHYFQIARLKYSQPLPFKRIIAELGLENRNDLIDLLNSVTPQNGWFVKEYSEKRHFFTARNARRIQACRRKIMAWAQKGWLSHGEHAVLIASLINSMDKVANTAGTYYAFLKKWHRKARNDFRFDLIPVVSSKGKGYCFHEPAKELVRRRHFDILYLDPPYNQRSYAHYYHLPETLALGTTPKVHGLSGIPSNISAISEFNRPMEARHALIDILNNASFGLLLFHYTDHGIITPQEVRYILSSYGKIEDFLLISKGYTTKEKPRSAKHHLYMVQNA
jgi:adenine-specific DNA-methyltransferase